MQNEASLTITTTLYDLISALHVQVGSEEDRVITALVEHLIRTDRLTSPQLLNPH